MGGGTDLSIPVITATGRTDYLLLFPLFFRFSVLLFEQGRMYPPSPWWIFRVRAGKCLL